MTSPLCYSCETLRQARAQREAQTTLPVQPAKANPTELVPADAPMAEGLLIGFWADWLGEFVSWEKYITTCPIDRLIDIEAQARAERETRTTPPQPEPRRERRSRQTHLLAGFPS